MQCISRSGSSRTNAVGSGRGLHAEEVGELAQAGWREPASAIDTALSGIGRARRGGGVENGHGKVPFFC